MVNQKTAVTNAVLSLFPDYEMGGEVVLSTILNKESKDKIKVMLFEGFKADEVSMSDEASAKYSGDDKGLQKYANGLVDNWVRKNPDFNNGEKYEIKNKGSRAGSQDDQVKALRSLLKTPGLDAEAITEINKSITERLNEIRPAKQSAPINVDALPEHLRHLVTTTTTEEA